MCQEAEQGNYGILRHLPAASRVLSPRGLAALAGSLETQLKGRDDKAIAEIVRRDGWIEFAQRYPETAEALQLRFWEALRPAIKLINLRLKAQVKEQFLRLQYSLPLVPKSVRWVRHVLRKLRAGE